MSIKQLITISNQVISDNQEEPTVNARELHAFLEVETHFKDWIKRRIDEYGFIEGADYVKFELSADLKMAESGGDLSKILNAQKSAALETTGCGSFGQQGRIEYAITLDMAKELSMVERTAKGKEARQYFIACEKTLKQNTPILDDELRKAIYALVQEALADALKPKPKPKQPPRLNHNPRFAGWQETIYQWLQTKSYGEEFTLKQIAKEALGLEPHELDRPAEMAIGTTLKSLHCNRFRARRNKKKGYFYMVNGREF